MEFNDASCSSFSIKILEMAKSGIMALNYDIRREQHAIGEFSARMQFANGVGAQTFAKVTLLLKVAADKLDLPAPLNLQTFSIAVGNPLTPPPAAMSGSGYQRFSSNGEIACSLVCDFSSITLTLREYDRWHNVLPQIVETFSTIGAAYLAEVPAISVFSVQYVNEFRAKNSEFTNTAELFQKDSKWISPFSFASEQPWHCHVGQFIPTDGPYRFLLNLNCDISPNIMPGERIARNYARILIMAGCYYDLPQIGPLIVSEENLQSSIEKNFNDAHSLEKRILGEIISNEYLALMGDGAHEH